MAAAGDLVRSADGYRLSDRLLARQRRQDAALNPPTHGWDGQWLTVLVTATGADARTRTALRAALREVRFGELREGVWLRPDNLDTALPPVVHGRVRVLRATDDDPAGLAALLWDLPGWVQTGWPRPTMSRPVSRSPRGSCAICSPTRCCLTRYYRRAGRARNCGTATPNSQRSWPGGENPSPHTSARGPTRKRRDERIDGRRPG